ncbi:hypothetical protein [Orenia marismortui]|uniref:hypothetical protein n=1 Tax=Orenia marismortui TaxID=46469 RepID=UPI0003655239|nr:hypothetical protein [Orenia marismortui]
MNIIFNSKGIIVFMFFILSFFILSSCDNKKMKIDKVLNYSNDKIKFTVNIEKVIFKKNDNRLKTFVYGKIIIDNISKTDSIYSLEDIFLILGDNEISSNAYIDSVGSVIIQDNNIKNDKQKEHKVYWVFNRRLNLHSIKNLKLLFID